MLLFGELDPKKLLKKLLFPNRSGGPERPASQHKAEKAIREPRMVPTVGENRLHSHFQIWCPLVAWDKQGLLTFSERFRRTSYTHFHVKCSHW